MKKKLALFDFDGTLIAGDSLHSFLRIALPAPRLALGMAQQAPRVLAALLGMADKSRAKERLLAELFTGWNREALQEAGRTYAAKFFPRQLRPGAAQRVASYLADGFRVIIVTASMEEWVAPCAKALGAECIATRLEYREGVFTGRFATPNCIREEKVRRIQTLLDPSLSDEIHAYGDSPSDLPMLRLAQRQFYRPDYSLPLE